VDAKKTHYLVRSSRVPSLIYCTDGGFHHEGRIGPGRYSAKLYRRQAAARRVRRGEGIEIVPCDRFGVA
jgi:hypothetical protein